MYLFLDFDGVLNSDRFFKRKENEGWRYRARMDEVELFDRDAIDRLDQICARAPLQIVISSSWRKGTTAAKLRRLLKRAGFRHSDRIVDVTPDFGERSRHTEIAHWLRTRGQGGPFVILDDEDDMGPLSRHHVRTDYQSGLLDEHVRQALRVLSGGRMRAR